MGQNYDKDLFIVLVGTGTTTMKNFVDNMEDYIFGPKDEREAELLIPYTDKMTPTLGKILNEWAVGDFSEPNYPIHAFVQGENGHKSVASAKQTVHVTEEHGVAMESAAVEAAMEALLTEQANGNEVVVVVLYDEENDVDLVGSLKNYNSIPVLNLDGMIDSFPGFRTTDEILQEEREREAFEAEEAERLAAEKEAAKVAKKAAAAPAKKAAAPRKRAAKAVVPEEAPLTEADVKAPAPRKRVAKKAAPAEPKVEEQKEPEYKVGDVVEVGGIPFVKHSELPSELEPVKVLTDKSPGVNPLMTPMQVREDVWTDVAQAKAEVDKGQVTHYAVSKENLASLSEGITEMAQSFSKVMASMTRIIEGE